ncbi:hypothetical protein J4463_03480 [Candidatus Pacearchaeota archaeon]|nr:hypothetical protein [Candidatus Pacearchaeota archaeon]
MKSKEWIGVIAVVLIVAVVASLVTMSIAGDVIKVKPVLNGTNVYTKAEVDTMLKRIVADAVSTRILDIRSLNNSIRFQATDINTVTMNGKFIADDLISRNSFFSAYIKASNISTYTLKMGLTGNGTAYACLDNNGKLYRSLTACR